MEKIKIVMIALIISLIFYGLALAAGDYTASGTYDYDSTAQTMDIKFQTNNFPVACEIHDITLTNVILEATSLQWTNEEVDNTQTWTRSSGTAGDIVGTWTIADPLVLTLNADNTFTLVGTNFSCGEEDPPADAPGGGGDDGGGCFINTLQK